MNFRIHAVPIEPFAADIRLCDDALRARGMRRVVADARPAYPCRVSLQDAVEGERLLLTTYLHHDVATPYRASGPIYVRESAVRMSPDIDEIPALLRSRLLSLRAYDARGMMLAADVVPGSGLESGIAQLFSLEASAYLHVHYAKPGCYACRIERV